MPARSTAITIFLFAGAACLSAQTIDDVRRQFQHPPKQFGPMVRWWWPGGDVEPAELRREIAELDQGGFAGAEVQPFNIGLKPDMGANVLARVNDYATDSFYAKVRAALDEARKRGLLIDLTLGSGWPFGGGEAITPELSSLELRSAYRSVTGPKHFHERITLPDAGGMGLSLSKMLGSPREMPPGWQKRWDNRTKIVAVLAFRGTAPVTELIAPNPLIKRTIAKASGQLDRSSMVILTNRVLADGSLDWQVPAGTWQLVQFVSQPSNMRVLGGVGGPPQLVMDHMNKAALAAHIGRVMGPARKQIEEYFGNTLRAIFCDSLEVEAEQFWSDNFLAEFRKRHGYDLTPWLPFLEVPGVQDPYNGPTSEHPLFDAKGAAKVRDDYWQTVSDLWMENFFAPLVEWAHHNGLKAEIQAHGAPTELLNAYGLADIPETEQLFAGGRLEFLKLASSAAHTGGHKLVTSESFVHQGMAYQSTKVSLEKDVNSLIAGGVNQIIYHGFPYYYNDRPEPGWYPFGPPTSFSDHFNSHAKIWTDVPSVNAYISRLQYIAQTGTPVLRFAVYRNEIGYQAPSDASVPGTLDYDYLNDNTLKTSKVIGGRLVTSGGAEYDSLFLPKEDPRLRARLRGLKIQIGNPPSSELYTRWKLAGAEFSFYYNSGDKEHLVMLTPGKYEIWDAANGSITPLASLQLSIPPGAGKLVCLQKMIRPGLVDRTSTIQIT